MSNRTHSYDNSTSTSCANLHAWYHRWHQHAKPGRYLVTILWSGFIRSVDAVVDDFGDLVSVN